MPDPDKFGQVSRESHFTDPSQAISNTQPTAQNHAADDESIVFAADRISNVTMGMMQV